MPTPDGVDDLYTRLVAANAEAMRDGLYEVAYHALAAALHAAEALGDAARLEAVERLAERQQEHIDEHAPDHLLSTRSAGERGRGGLFPTLARQAHLKARLARTPRA